MMAFSRSESSHLTAAARSHKSSPDPKIPFPACFCASRLPTWMQSSARIFRSTPYLAYLFIMAAQLWRGQSRIRCRPLLHNLVNGWRRAAVIRGFLWLKFFYKLFVCLALRQLLHPPKNGHEKTTVRVHRGSIVNVVIYIWPFGHIFAFFFQLLDFSCKFFRCFTRRRVFFHLISLHSIPYASCASCNARWNALIAPIL